MVFLFYLFIFDFFKFKVSQNKQVRYWDYRLVPSSGKVRKDGNLTPYCKAIFYGMYYLDELLNFRNALKYYKEYGH